MSKLFSPITIKNLTLKNRLVVSPMCQYSATDGFVNDWHFVHLGSRAVGGAGLIFTEAAAVAPEGRISPNDVGIWKDEHIEGLRKIADFVIAQGAQIGIQLAHAGRKASVSAPWKGNKLVVPTDGGWKTIAPSSISFNENYDVPETLTLQGIQQIVQDFKNAARRALQANVGVIEIHAAHGYLIHQFLSPLSNTRTDEYGGSFDNRIRFLLQIIDEIKTVWSSEKPIFVRISATEWTENGWTEEDSIKLATVLVEKGIDLIDCSTGGNAAQAKIPVAPAYQVRFAQSIKKQVNILTGAVGLISDAIQAESILVTEQADLIFMARELLRDPYFPLKAADQLADKSIVWPLQYERAKFHH
jgi:2,4-dienoyl-CoA reductase-like NADH-dependent reductase (Old Yellow Enzyme family)